VRLGRIVVGWEEVRRGEEKKKRKRKNRGRRRGRRGNEGIYIYIDR
jgi:hypothetical protein